MNHNIIIIRDGNNILLDYDEINSRHYIYEFYNKTEEYIESFFNLKLNMSIKLSDSKQIKIYDSIYYDILLGDEYENIKKMLINVDNLYKYNIRHNIINNIKRKVLEDNKTKIGGIIYDTAMHKILLVRGTMKWSLPKGHFEPLIDKNDIECAKREIYEETSLRVEINETTPYKILAHIKYYIIEMKNGSFKELNPVDTNEILDIKWFSIEEIRDIDRSIINASVIKLCDSKYYDSILSCIKSESKKTLDNETLIKNFDKLVVI